MRPKIYFILNGKRGVVENLKLDEKNFEENKSKVLIDGKALNPCVLDMVFKPEGKKGMDWTSFKSGYLK